MEKHGAIQPGITPPEKDDAAVKTGALEDPLLRELSDRAARAKIEKLDDDFRKYLATAVEKKL